MFGAGSLLGRDDPVPKVTALGVQSRREIRIVSGDGVFPLLMNQHHFTLVLNDFAFGHGTIIPLPGVGVVH